MSVAWVQWALDRAPAEGREQVLLIALADSANEDGVSWPSVGTLARRARTSERHVRRLLSDLEGRGLITRETRVTEGRMTSNAYQLHPVAGAQVAPRPLTPRSAPPDAQVIPPPDAQVIPPPDAQVIPPPDAQVTLTISKNHQKEPTDSPLPPKGAGKRAKIEPSGGSTGNNRYAAEEAPVLPDGLSRVAWARWCLYRRQRRKTLTPLSAESQLRFLATQPDPEACIEQSVRNGWTGVFAVKERAGGGPRKASAAERVAEAMRRSYG